VTHSPVAELLGWWLALLLPALAMVGPLRRDRGAAHAYLFTVLVHIAAAVMYAYYRDSLPPALMRGDTHGFHRAAIVQQWMGEISFSIGSEAYEAYLAYVYKLFGPSFFLGSILSVYAFAFSVIVLVKFMEILNIQQGKGLVVVLFGALPTSVLYGTVPMREPYQVLFFMLACYSMVRFRFSSQPLHLIAAVLFALTMGLLHRGLLLYAPFLIVVMLLVRVDHGGARSARRTRTYLHRLAGVAVAIAFLVGISGAEEELAELGGAGILVTATTGGGLVEYTQQSREGEGDARTAYGVTLDTSSPGRMAYSSVLILVHYMFTPFPWQVSYKRDIYAFAEVILRVGCLMAIFRMWRRGGPVNPQIITLLMIVYFSMALLWSGGTLTWGTATRHHMVHQWLLLLIGVPALIQTFPGLARRQPAAPSAGASRASASPGPLPQPRIPHLRSLLDTTWPPPRLGDRALRGLQMADAAPRVLGRGLGRLRRLTGT
jgi:hypothetical protein